MFSSGISNLEDEIIFLGAELPPRNPIDRIFPEPLHFEITTKKSHYLAEIISLHSFFTPFKKCWYKICSLNTAEAKTIKRIGN